MFSHLSLLIHNEFVLRNEHIHYVDSLVKQTTAIAAQVKDKAFKLVLFFHLHDDIFQLFSTIFSKLRQNCVSNAIIEHRIIRNVIDFYLLTLQFLHYRFFLTLALHLKFHGSSGSTFQQLAHLACVFAAHIYPIDFQEDIARDKTCFSSRETFVRL